MQSPTTPATRDIETIGAPRTRAEKQKSGTSRQPQHEPRMLKTCKSVSENITMNNQVVVTVQGYAVTPLKVPEDEETRSLC